MIQAVACLRIVQPKTGILSHVVVHDDAARLHPLCIINSLRKLRSFLKFQIMSLKMSSPGSWVNVMSAFCSYSMATRMILPYSERKQSHCS